MALLTPNSSPIGRGGVADEGLAAASREKAGRAVVSWFMPHGLIDDWELKTRFRSQSCRQPERHNASISMTRTATATHPL